MKILAGNWKMNLIPSEAEAYLEAFSRLLVENGTWVDGATEVQIYAPALSLQAAMRKSAELKLPLRFGAQNAHWERSGAFTGELSGPMLQASGIGHVLIGHSERRQHFGETSESAARRALSLLEQGIQVLFCVGETLSEREKDHTARTLEEQMAPLVKGLQSIEPGRLSRLNLAYEPVWAIGTGRTASPDQANEAHRILHEICAKRAPNFHPRILYGGSVTPENFSELLRQPGIDGGLVGGGSLKPDTFSKLLKILLEAR